MKPLLIVDGYNIIGAWSEAERQGWSLDECRDRLMLQLQDYGGYTGEEIVLVFDGYQSDKRLTTEEKHGALTLVFTRHGETADSYIERLTAQFRNTVRCVWRHPTALSRPRCWAAVRRG